MNNIRENLNRVRQEIRAATIAAQRTIESVQLLAVSKQQNASAIREAYEAGQHCFGENYVQEALIKMPLLSDLAIEWHFIGRIQANKTRDIAENFAWVHTLDRADIAKRLNDQRPSDLPPLQVCIQVNLAHEPQKGGIPVEELLSLAKIIQSLPHLKLRGLMMLPPAELEDTAALAHFLHLAHLQQQLCSQAYDLDTLSIGTSQDFPMAIAAGATIVRIGTAIFGLGSRK